MFKCIHVSNFDTSNISPITNETIKSYKSKYDKILINLENLFLNSEEAFDVDKINKELFSDVQPDIFLSHSHADEKDVIKLAAKIELHTGLSVFVDSCVWANAYSLLQKIDDKYCYQSATQTYSYQKRNHTTSNVFMILNAALHRVINSCEVLLFLGTDNSINIQDLLTSEKYISSPWIFSELQFANLVERIPPNRYKLTFESFDNAGLAEDSSSIIKNAKFAYPTPPSDFDLDNDELCEWVNNLIFTTRTHPLELLYKYESSDIYEIIEK